MSRQQESFSDLLIRFVFGFIAGLVVGFFSVSFYAPETSASVMTLTLGTGLVFGLLAVVFGNDFWRGIGKWW